MNLNSLAHSNGSRRLRSGGYSNGSVFVESITAKPYRCFLSPRVFRCVSGSASRIPVNVQARLMVELQFKDDGRAQSKGGKDTLG